MIRVIIWECVGDVFGEVDLKILHIVAKNSSRHLKKKKDGNIVQY